MLPRVCGYTLFEKRWHHTAANHRETSVKEKLQITAYEVIEDPMPLRSAQRTRQWMDDTVDRFAYRCLPVGMAN